MNERIKLLIEQAQDWADAHAPYASEEQEYFAEKFAELIVRECMDLLEDFTTDIHVGGITYNVVGASETLREHFGIEE